MELSNKLKIIPRYDIHLEVSKLEVTNKRKNVGLVKAKVEPSYRWGGKQLVCKLYGNWSLIRKQLGEIKSDGELNKTCLTIVCACCKNRDELKLRSSGCLRFCYEYLQLTNDEGRQYLYLFCSPKCKELFDLNPLAYENNDANDTTVHI